MGGAVTRPDQRGILEHKLHCGFPSCDKSLIILSEHEKLEKGGSFHA